MVQEESVRALSSPTVMYMIMSLRRLLTGVQTWALSLGLPDHSLDLFSPRNRLQKSNPVTVIRFFKLKLGILRTLRKKWYLITCFQSISFPSNTKPASAGITVIYGGAIIKMLRPGLAEEFEDYVNTTVFICYTKTQIQNIRGIDIIWHVCM